MAKKKKKKEQPKPWLIHYFKRHKDDDPPETTPAREFIAACPTGVRADIIATLKAVAEGPPPQFGGGGRWQAMHDSMKGYYEVRAMGPGKTLYRVFCLLERAEEKGLGLAYHSVIMVAGMSKASGTAFSEADYAAVRRLGDEFRSRKPRSVA